MGILSGKKTYIVLGLFLIAAVAGLAFGVDVPETVWGLLAALGFAAVRSALKAVNGNTGWKTYAAAGITVLISGAELLGLNIPLEVITLIYTVTGSLGIVGIRDAVTKLKV